MLKKLGALIISTSAIFSISLFSSSNAALAWFTICNKSGSTADVAFAYLDIPDPRQRDDCRFLTGCEPLPPNQRVWNSEGWWNLSSGQCVQVYPHELTQRNSFYYIYANAVDGSGAWTGKNYFCTLNTAFTLALADRKCSGAGRKWKPFIEVNTGNNRNFTYNLTD